MNLRSVVDLALAGAFALCALAARADDNPPPTRLELPHNVSARAGRVVQDDVAKSTCLYDYADLLAEPARIQADTICYDHEAGTVVATGNVVFSFTGAVLAGSRAFYRIESQTGEIDDVVGYFEQDAAILRADKVEKIGPQRLRVENAWFSTCTQPLPYWTFHLSRGTFDIGQYAYLHNVSFRARGLPLFWSPYLVWPIKTDRATGLLFPEFKTSNKLGTSIGIPFYWPFAKNADLTLQVDAYTKVGVGLRTTLDWLPTWRGEAHGDFYWINDQVKEKNRWSGTWRHTQALWKDWQFTANLEQVSDFDYFTDYETDLQRAAAARTRSTADLTRTWSWYALSARTRRYAQYFVSGSLLTGKSVNVSPQVEWRGRSQQLGRTPVFLSFVSSVAGFSRDILGLPETEPYGVQSEDALITESRERWGRIDAGPQLQLPLIKSAWGDLSLNGAWRGTWYTASPDPADPQQLVSEGVFRSLWSAGVSFAGPRFQRVFLTPGWNFSPKLKHVIEPFLEYQWRPQAGATAAEVPVFDEVDAIPGKASFVLYGFRQRFYALRPAETARPSGLATARETSFEGLQKEKEQQAKRDDVARTEPGVIEEELAVDEALTPIEIASVDLQQGYSFIATNSGAFVPVIDPATGQVVSYRRHTPVRARFRVNPTLDEVVDATLVYDPDNQVVNETSISVRMRFSDTGYLAGRWYRNQSSVPAADSKSSFLRAEWGYMLPNRRLSLETEWDWDVESNDLVHQAYRVRWATQCCAFRLGYDKREFVDNYRSEYSLVVDLTGIGKILDLQQAFE